MLSIIDESLGAGVVSMMMGSQDSDIVALFKQGLDEHNAGNLSAAKKMYHKILAIQPDHCEANHNIGDCACC